MEITTIPHRILAKKTQIVAAEAIKSGEYTDLILNMRQAMKEHVGVGLAANQVGKDLALFVIDAAIAQQNGVPDVYFNPEITEYSSEIDYLEEGCLSIPGFYTEIKRSRKIMFKALDDKGKKLKFKAKGFLARVLQHETDHLNGVVIKDRAKQ